LILLYPPPFIQRWLNYHGAPKWNDVTLDGDFAFLPEDQLSIIGEKWIREGFARNRSKSQMVLVVAADQKLEHEHFAVANDLLRRIRNLQGIAAFQQAMLVKDQLARETKPNPELKAEYESNIKSAISAFDDAIEREGRIAALLKTNQNVDHVFALPYYNLAQVYRESGDVSNYQYELRIALALDPSLPPEATHQLPQIENLPIVDMWDWHDHGIKQKLVSKDGCARLAVVQISNEFVAVENIRMLEILEAEIAVVRDHWAAVFAKGDLHTGISGSAAVGADMLRAAKDGIRNTEVVTVSLVLIILLLIYRAPILIAIPLVSIGVSLFAATAVLAALTQLDSLPGFGWWELKVFTTTKIFIVVILFGAGTDYCLFLIARYKEELATGAEPDVAIERTIAAVGDAILASALTTIVGLGMMYFADFGKYKFSGPVIGISLLVTLAACLTLAPALLRMTGRLVFWPSGVKIRTENSTPIAASRFWSPIANLVIRYPGRILLLGFVLLAPAAGYGWLTQDRVTYDLFHALPDGRPSKVGARLMRRHFPIGETGPITLLAKCKDADFDRPEQWGLIADLTKAVREADERVISIRSIVDPLGDYPDGNVPRTNLTLQILRPRMRDIFISSTQGTVGEITRLELITSEDPFSPAAAEILDNVHARVLKLQSENDPFWSNSEFAFTGITAAIHDLRAVTRSDTQRIEVLVVLAVFGVLLVILKRPVACLYLILTVLVSFYATMGISQWFFEFLYGAGYPGMDWKSPLFLFVILVAVGQDYNVYLATRVFEEQQRRGPFAGLRFAMIQTGGIITSCGIIMAGTFISMTSGVWGELIPSWLPGAAYFQSGSGALRGMVELGFSLSLGILLDTLVVRTVLVPTYFALHARWKAGRTSLTPTKTNI
jgi:RND superfamily putative drug exporter